MVSYTSLFLGIALDAAGVCSIDPAVDLAANVVGALDGVAGIVNGIIQDL